MEDVYEEDMFYTRREHRSYWNLYAVVYSDGQRRSDR